MYKRDIWGRNASIGCAVGDHLIIAAVMLADELKAMLEVCQTLRSLRRI